MLHTKFEHHAKAIDRPYWLRSSRMKPLMVIDAVYDETIHEAGNAVEAEAVQDWRPRPALSAS